MAEYMRDNWGTDDFGDDEPFTVPVLLSRLGLEGALERHELTETMFLHALFNQTFNNYTHLPFDGFFNLGSLFPTEVMPFIYFSLSVTHTHI